MADAGSAVDMSHPVLNLTPEEKRIFGQLFQQADTDKIGVITGEVAVKFFERTKLDSDTLGKIWQIADTDNRGFLSPAGFSLVLRLIGHVQNGKQPTQELAFQPAPLPKFMGLNLPSGVPPGGSPAPLQQQSSGPIRVPPLTPDKATEYAGLFEKSGAQNGLLSGENAKQIFEKARLDNDVLGRIWNLADTEQRGALSQTEFIIAMHLLASYKSRAMTALPMSLPAGLYEAAARRGPPPSRGGVGPGPLNTGPIPRQLSGQRTQSPATRAPYGTPPPQSAQPTGGDWLITAQEKSQYDQLFTKVDAESKGFITGEQAVTFFSDSGLSEDILASIWDLADINSEGKLNRDEFAVAMYLIRQQRGKPQSIVPPALPPKLIPPSMRNQPRPVSQTTAPAFDNAAFSSNLPKSASEDLFGLDAFSSPPPVQHQSTGGSATMNRGVDSDPFGSKAASPTAQHFQPSPRNPATVFAPFKPSSSFGQGLTQHATGGSASSGQQRGMPPAQPSAMDDLLGDNDPEVSKKLTDETSELANMSNQIGQLRNQMQEVQSKKTVTERDLSGTSTQKRDLELRLQQFRSQYDEEVKQVKSLEERLTASRADTQKMQRDYAMIQGTYQDLQNQRRQVSEALQADQRENTTLKERIRQVTAEVNQLRPQLDKMRSEARQQKGMVAINKKQLATNEGERDKVKGEMSDLTTAAQENARPPTSGQGSAVASPAASTASPSTNPFFRKTPQPSFDNTMTPAGFQRSATAPSNKDQFDSFFNNAFPPSQPTKSENTPTFGSQSGPSVQSSGPDMPTPSTSPPLSSYHESPRVADPPPPPESRQITSNNLPLRENLPRSESFSSSVRVATPASRFGGMTGTDTPTNVAEATPSTEAGGKSLERTDTSKTETGNFGSSPFNRGATASPAASASSDARSGSRAEDRGFQGFGPPSTSRDVPGAFPEEPIQATTTGNSTLSDRSKGSTRPSEGLGSTRSDPFSSVGKAPANSKADFDAAFASFGGGRPQEKQHTGSSMNGEAGAASKFNQEFPPIEDLEHDDDSDSTTSGKGFDDDYTAPSPEQERQKQPEAKDGTNADYLSARPTMSHTESAASLPTPNAQKSPPSYDQTVTSAHERSGSNQFPPEFSGLLPSREDPTSPHQSSESPDKSFTTSGAGSQGHALFGGSSSTSPPLSSSTAVPPYSTSPPADTSSSTDPLSSYHSAASHPSEPTKSQSPITSQPPAPSKPTDDFDTGFDDMAEAQEDSDKGDDDFLTSDHRDGFDEFNPVFDSPAASKSNTMTTQQTPTGKQSLENSAFGDFSSSIWNSSESKPAQQDVPKPAASAHDWDAIFSGLDAPSAEASSSAPAQDDNITAAPASASSPFGSSKELKEEPSMPQLGRALSSGTDHDDPILKRLTGMGYDRSDALDALEKYDYDINKAVDHLTSQ